MNRAAKLLQNFEQVAEAYAFRGTLDTEEEKARVTREYDRLRVKILELLEVAYEHQKPKVRMPR